MGVGVFVLGMHRSGTSATTRLVNLLGVPTCVEEDFFPTRPDNPRGHWECRSLTGFNDRLLASLGCDWSCPPRMSAGWEADRGLDDLRAEAAAVFTRVMPTQNWVWKDPRNCIALPFWMRELEVRPVAVLVHRNPLAIAASLRIRNSFSKQYALALWERYLRSCVSALRGIPTVVVLYDELVSDPPTWCETLREFLSGVGVKTSSAHESEIRGFVAQDLRHARFTPGELLADPVVTAAQRDLFHALEEMQTSSEGLPRAQLPDESSSTEPLLAKRREAFAAEGYARTADA